MRPAKKRLWVLAAAVSALSISPGPLAFAQEKPRLTVAMPSDMRGMDPHKISAGSDDNVFANVFENLYTIDTEGGLRPQLAEAVDVSPDGRVYEFKLREGVTFHNGDPFTADDVVYSWKRGTDPSILNPRAVLVLRNIESIDIVNPYRIRIALKTVDAGFLHNMQGGFYIVSKKYMESSDDAKRTLIGTGPFVFVERKIGEYVKLAANEKHWGTVPKVREVLMRIVPDSQARFAMVQTGEADIVSFVPAFIASREQNAKNYKIIRGPALVNVFLQIHTRSNNPDMKKPEVRRAFNMALNRPALFKTITFGYGALHQGAPCSAPVFGCDPAPSAFPYDPEGARKLLQQANFDFSRPVRIVAPATTGGSIPQARETAEAVAYSLQQIGVKTDLVIKEYAAWLAEDQQARHPKDPKGDIVMSMVPDFNVTPGARLRRTLLTGGIFSWFSDAELDAMISNLDSIPSTEARLRAARDIWQKVHELAPTILLWSYDALYAARNNIEWKPQFGALNYVLYNVEKR